VSTDPAFLNGVAHLYGMAAPSAESLLGDQRTNAFVGWVLLVVLGAGAIWSFVAGDLQWGVFVGGVLVLCLLVPVVFRDPTVMLPWEVVTLAALPTFGRAVATFSTFKQFSLYLSVAALALVVAVELNLFTRVRMTVGFAITFVVLATLATAGLWALVRWALDITLGTETLLESGVSEETVHDELMIEFVYSALAGVVAGVVFEGYFRRYRTPKRLPEEVIERENP
jgi:hypothetical protein